MRLHDIAARPSFFLATSQPQKPGTVLKVVGTVHPLGASLEGRLEAVRPDWAFSRTNSLYIHTDQDDVTGEHVFEIEPMGRLHRNHTSWLRQLEATNSGNVGALDQFSRAYWSGKECPEQRDLPWEYRTNAARIVRRIGGRAIGRKDGSAV